ncbi:MAG TPA: DNA mismatch repair protein MutT [Cyanobacteria bacterium UBA11049]|nr:DNA mismatch repair protein MutT [Cyanobacteria bacterium UBA11049]
MRKPRITALAVIYRDTGSCREFLVQCADSEPFYRFPGGSIEFGETASITIVREMQEEFDLDVAVGPLWIINENFFTYREYTGHSISLLHVCYLTNGMQVSELRHKEHNDVKLVWRSQHELSTKPLYPQGVLAHLIGSVDQIVHLVSRQGENI